MSLRIIFFQFTYFIFISLFTTVFLGVVKLGGSMDLVHILMDPFSLAFNLLKQ